MRLSATAAIAFVLAFGASAACANLSGLTSGDAGSADAGAPAATDIPEGGLPSQPGVYDCPSPTECPLATSYCCAGRTGYACVPPTTPCQANAVHCKEKADCPEPQVCCVHLLEAGVVSKCQTECSLTPQACRTNSECQGGQCVPQLCHGVLFAEFCNAPSAPPPGCP